MIVKATTLMQICSRGQDQMKKIKIADEAKTKTWNDFQSMISKCRLSKFSAQESFVHKRQAKAEIDLNRSDGV